MTDLTNLDEVFGSQKSQVSAEAKQIAKRFSTAVSDLRWRCDYVKFCKILDVAPSDYAKKEYNKFLQLAESLQYFDTKSLAKLIDAADGRR
jgi:cephalosporin-C deacetylase-like acetyl esterase